LRHKALPHVSGRPWGVFVCAAAFFWGTDLVIPPVLPTYARAPLSFVAGEGAWLIEESGERYLDLGAGIAVTLLGHANPALVEALETQARRLWHTSNLYKIPNQEALAERLVAHTFADTVFVTNSGTEAIECAIKMARKHFDNAGQPERLRIIAFEGAFHGRSYGAISAAGSDKMVKGFGPMVPGFDHVPFGDLEAVETAIGAETAAILVEPIQGEGGIRALTREQLRDLRALCDAHGLLLILDEVQCGMGRTGKLFHHEWAGITPDIMTVAKGLGGGFPIGACLATERAAAGMTTGTHGSTYGGNPLACAVGCAVMDIVTAPGFLDGVSRLAGRFRQGLEGLVAAHPEVFEGVRGEGLMLGLKCVKPVADVVRAGYDARVIAVPAAENVARLLPPLNLTEAEAEEGLRRLDRAAAALEAA
jgi:acetylornithine/N-succinyldiaminopimelate aminotransferase